ncbi:MAG: thrombospondin type-1 domain-containing protein [Labilithrix sp.]|nr:thrombospondin type-1 domain-containing protein [Labilithrix sp.]MBX3220584.1 thrombospondin type-1 domain-containing protein [Labilithrix sp.]
MMKRSVVCLRALALVSLAGAAYAAAGCSTANDEDTVSPDLGVVNRSRSALVGEVKSIDGVYGAGCAGHTENEAWSAAAVPDAPLAHAALRVRRSDASCTLKLTHVRSALGDFAASPAIALSGSYSAASAFNDSAQTAVDFYGSAKLGDPTFASNFSIDLLFIDPTNDGDPAVQYPDGYEHSFTVTEGDVPAPDFGFSTSDHTLLTDEHDVVTTSSGYLQLALNNHSAQTYAVVHGLLTHGMSPAEVASQIQSAPHSGALSAPYRIPASALDLVGADLTHGVSRSIILRNTDQGVSSYQVLRIKFVPRPSWAAGSWGTCSAVCGGGTQTRTVSCQLSGADVDSSLCVASRPATSRACNEDACGTWVSDAWGACSAVCGDGTQTRVNRCRVSGSDVDASYCPETPPATTQACNEGSCGADLGALHTNGSCGVLGVLGPGFTLTAGPSEALPVGTTITITGSGVANIGVFTVTGGTASVTVLSGTARQIVLTSALPAGATMAFRTTLSISVAFTLGAQVTLPEGYVGTGAKSSGSVTSTLVLCSAT